MFTLSRGYQTPEEFAAARPFHKAQRAQTLELFEGSAPELTMKNMKIKPADSHYK